MSETYIVFIGTQTFTALPIRCSSRSWIGWCRGRWWITRGRCWLKSFLCLLMWHCASLWCSFLSYRCSYLLDFSSAFFLAISSSYFPIPPFSASPRLPLAFCLLSPLVLQVPLYTGQNTFACYHLTTTLCFLMGNWYILYQLLWYAIQRTWTRSRCTRSRNTRCKNEPGEWPAEEARGVLLE